MRLIDEAGREVAPGEIGAMGEIVGHSPAMMSGYHRQPEQTREAEWYAPDGKRFIRTGDVGRQDSQTRTARQFPSRHFPLNGANFDAVIRHPL